MDIREEKRQDMLQDAKEAQKYEKLMYEDYEYAFNSFNLNEQSTVAEIRQAMETLNQYGHDITFSDLIEEI